MKDKEGYLTIKPRELLVKRLCTLMMLFFFLVKRGENLLYFKDLHSHENYELTPERCPVSPCAGIFKVY